MRTCVAVDGSKHSLNAVQCVIDHADSYREKPTVELVTVHLPVPKLPGMGAAVGKGQLAKYYEEEGQQQLAAAKKKLDAAGIPYNPKVLVGPVAESIVKHAKSTRCAFICVGTRGMSAVGTALLGSIATDVVRLSDLPVMLVK
jgi:nucleotide-binding universal stress UspA family protein